MVNGHSLVTGGPEPTAEQRRDAVRCVAGNARDGEDLRLLLGALDLDPSAAVDGGGEVR